MDNKKLTYAQAYAQLHSIAERFKSGGPGDIDGLVTDFRQAREAHTICRNRLDEIRAEIEAEIARTKPAAGGEDPSVAA